MRSLFSALCVSLLVSPPAQAACELSVAPATALLAALKSAGETSDDCARIAISQLLFEGKTPATAADYTEFLQLGLTRLQNEADNARDDVEVKLDETPNFLLVRDQIRKFFDTDFALHYLKHVAFAKEAPAGQVDFSTKLEQLEKAILAALAVRIPKMVQALDYSSFDALVAGGEAVFGDHWWYISDIKREYENAKDSLVTSARFGNLREGVLRLLRIFFLNRYFTFGISGGLPLNQVYAEGDFFGPRARYLAPKDEETRKEYFEDMGLLAPEFAGEAAAEGCYKNRFPLGCLNLTAIPSLLNSQELDILVEREGETPVYSRTAEEYLPDLREERGKKLPFVEEVLKRKVHSHISSSSGGALMLFGVLNELWRARNARDLKHNNHIQKLWTDFGRIAVSQQTSESDVPQTTGSCLEEVFAYMSFLAPSPFQPCEPEPLQLARIQFLRKLFHALTAATVGVLGGHVFFEMLLVPHMKELGGGLGKEGSTAVRHPHLDGRFAELVQRATVGSDGSEDRVDGIVMDLYVDKNSGVDVDGTIPKHVVDRAWDFLRTADPAVGGLGMVLRLPRATALTLKAVQGLDGGEEHVYATEVSTAASGGEIVSTPEAVSEA